MRGEEEVAPVQPLAWELAYAASVALKEKKKNQQVPYRQEDEE